MVCRIVNYDRTVLIECDEDDESFFLTLHKDDLLIIPPVVYRVAERRVTCDGLPNPHGRLDLAHVREVEILVRPEGT